MVAVEEAQPRLEDPVGNSEGLGDERDGLSAQIVEASLEVGRKATDASRGVIGLGTELNEGLDCEDVLQGLFLGHEPVGGVAEEVADGLQDGFGPNGRPRPVHEAVDRDGPVAVRLLRVCCLGHRGDGALEDLSWPG